MLTTYRQRVADRDDGSIGLESFGFSEGSRRGISLVQSKEIGSSGNEAPASARLKMSEGDEPARGKVFTR